MPQTNQFYRRQRKQEVRKRRTREYRPREQQREAQRHIRELERGLEQLGIEGHLAEVLRRKLDAQGKLMTKIFGMMFPPLFAARSYQELCRVQGWDKNLPGRLLGALPKRKWLERLQRLGEQIVSELWGRAQRMSEATQSRWQLTFVADDSVFRKYGERLRLVGSWYSGQEKRVVTGIDGLLLLVVLGDGKLAVPLDFEVRREDLPGPGRPCRDKMQWLEVMFARSLESLEARGLELGSPMLVADAWFGNSSLSEAIGKSKGATLLVEGKRSFTFHLPDGRKLSGKDLLTDKALPWRDAANTPGLRYARIHAKSPSFGDVTLTVVQPKGEDPYYLLCRKTSASSPSLFRAYGRRAWIEWCFPTLKHLLAVDACQFAGEAAYFGHLVLRLIGFSVLTYTVRRLLGARPTMERILESIKHHWRFLGSNLLEFQALSWEPELKRA